MAWRTSSPSAARGIYLPLPETCRLWETRGVLVGVEAERVREALAVV